ncbi:Got1/Sft2-like family-domain-containing protein [Chiua virens]|nr:Got1/Sft2-like family-domain-containing protein [Chiua virens]
MHKVSARLARSVQQLTHVILVRTEIGVALTTLGTLFMFLGVMLFFDAALLALGNMLFLSGLTLIIGPQKTFYFFARKQKLRGTICFLGGVLLVFFKYPFIGMIVETFGFLNLFGDFFPVVLTFLRQLPFVGTFLSLPYIRPVSRGSSGRLKNFSSLVTHPPTFRYVADV